VSFLGAAAPELVKLVVDVVLVNGMLPDCRFEGGRGLVVKVWDGSGGSTVVVVLQMSITCLEVSLQCHTLIYLTFETPTPL
jgi:hypothetical protein